MDAPIADSVVLRARFAWLAAPLVACIALLALSRPTHHVRHHHHRAMPLTMIGRC